MQALYKRSQRGRLLQEAGRCSFWAGYHSTRTKQANMACYFYRHPYWIFFTWYRFDSDQYRRSTQPGTGCAPHPGPPALTSRTTRRPSHLHPPSSTFTFFAALRCCINCVWPSTWRRMTVSRKGGQEAPRYAVNKYKPTVEAGGKDPRFCLSGRQLLIGSFQIFGVAWPPCGVQFWHFPHYYHSSMQVQRFLTRLIFLLTDPIQI